MYYKIMGCHLAFIALCLAEIFRKKMAIHHLFTKYLGMSDKKKLSLHKKNLFRISLRIIINKNFKVAYTVKSFA